MREVLINIQVTAQEYRALLDMSNSDCRPPREQMRYLLREAARARGLLPQSTEHTNGAPRPEKLEGAARG